MNVELLDHMGSDLDVVNAARVSFDKESELEEVWQPGAYGPEWTLSDKDTKLISYLAKHHHWTPFSHCYAKFRIKAPLFVRSQLFKHKVGLTENEVSRRYVDSPPEFYVPEVWRRRSLDKKQGSSWEAADIEDRPEEDCFPLKEWSETYWQHSVDLYGRLLKRGVCPEQARMVLPQSMMTEFIWSGSIAAFARVCQQRLGEHAQQETQFIARRISEELAPLFPVSWEALVGDRT